MGYCKPYYDEETALEIIEEIAKIDAKINDLAIEREERVKALKSKIKELKAN